jgi:hypothetical protein
MKSTYNEGEDILSYIRNDEYNTIRQDAMMIRELISVVKYLDERISKLEKEK